MTFVRAMLVAALALAVVSGGEPRELFKNGGFEDGLDGWRPLNMSKSASFELDTKVKQSGKQSLRFERKGQGAPDFLKISADLPVKKGKVALSLAYRVDKDSHVRVDAYFFDSTGETVGKGQISVVQAKTTKAFEIAKGEYEIPDKATGFGLNVVMDAPGTAWIDSVSATIGSEPSKPKKKSTSGLLDNGRFDGDLDGWMETTNGSGTAHSTCDTSLHSGGTGSLRLDRTSARLFPEDGQHTTVPDPGKSKRFHLAFQSRTSGAARAAVALQAFDAKDVVLSTSRIDAASTEKFAPSALVLDVPTSCDHLVVTLAIRGAGSAWFDDVVLESK